MVSAASPGGEGRYGSCNYFRLSCQRLGNWNGGVAELVNAAYGLKAEEFALMWRTAPPRMPGERPRV
jgi:hypothetical protein